MDDITFSIEKPDALNASSEIAQDSYDKILVAFSGGKDCLACVLHLIDLGLRGVTDKAASGTPYAGIADTAMVALAMSDEYHETVVIPSLLWMMPSGAFGEKAGPI
jgi:predicted PP-loop superfamily ATPase